MNLDDVLKIFLHSSKVTFFNAIVAAMNWFANTHIFYNFLGKQFWTFHGISAYVITLFPLFNLSWKEVCISRIWDVLSLFTCLLCHQLVLTFNDEWLFKDLFLQPVSMIRASRIKRTVIFIYPKVSQSKNAPWLIVGTLKCLHFTQFSGLMQALFILL